MSGRKMMLLVISFDMTFIGLQSFTVISTGRTFIAIRFYMLCFNMVKHMILLYTLIWTDRAVPHMVHLGHQG